MSDAPCVTIRLATDQDMEMVFAWRNTPEIVALSQSQREVAWEEHCKWFPEAIRAHDQRVLIIAVNCREIGLIRLQFEVDGCDVTIYVLPGWEHRGIGSFALETALREYGGACSRFVARILKKNSNSIAFFAKMGFSEFANHGDVLYYAREDLSIGSAGNIAKTNGQGVSLRQNDVISKYSELVSKHGISFKSVDWGSKESQYKRFSVFLDLDKFEGASVLDVGCGVGEFFQYLQDANIAVDYCGVDIAPAMVSITQTRFPSCHIEHRDIVAEPFDRMFDYVFASGVFCFMACEAEAFQLIEAMFCAARRGVAFNSLSTWASKSIEGELSLDPIRVVNFCRRLSSAIVLRHDYLEHDFTIFLYRELK